MLDAHLPARQLATAIAQIASTVDVNATSAAIGSALTLEARSQGVLTVSALGKSTDLSLELSADATPGAAVHLNRLAAAGLRALLGSLDSDASVQLAHADDQLTLACGRVKAQWATTSPSEAPAREALHADDRALALDLSGADLAGGLRVMYAANTSFGSDVFGNVRLEFGAAGLTLTATDGFRLATVTVPLVGERPSFAAQALLGVKGAAALARLAQAQGDDDVRVELIGRLPDKFHTLHARGRAWTLASRLGEGAYPDWRRIIPDEGDGRARLRLKRADLQGLLARLSIAANDPRADAAARRGDFALDASERRLAGQAGGMGGVLIQDDAPVEQVEGQPELPTLALNVRYLREAVEHATGEDVTLAYGPGPMTPVVLEAGAYRALVVPLRTTA